MMTLPSDPNAFAIRNPGSSIKTNIFGQADPISAQAGGDPNKEAGMRQAYMSLFNKQPYSYQGQLAKAYSTSMDPMDFRSQVGPMPGEIPGGAMGAGLMSAGGVGGPGGAAMSHAGGGGSPFHGPGGAPGNLAEAMQGMSIGERLRYAGMGANEQGRFKSSFNYKGLF